MANVSIAAHAISQSWQRTLRALVGMPKPLHFSSIFQYVPTSMASHSPSPCMVKRKPRARTTAGSKLFRVPAAALRAFTNNCSPSFSRCAFTRAKLANGMSISPRTSNTFGATPLRRSGTLRIILMLAVTSSPVTPSPRVSACVNTPAS